MIPEKSVAIPQSHVVLSPAQLQLLLETIYRVTESVRSLKPLELTLKEIHEQLMLSFDAPTCYIALSDPEAQLITFPYFVVNNEAVQQEPVPLQGKSNLVAWVMANNLPFATDDWESDEKPAAGIAGLAQRRSVICVPMCADDDVLGAISIQSTKPGAFDAADFQTLLAVAAHVAIIVKNARLYHQTQQQLAELAIAYEESKESDRLKDELVQNVSHELRTPLTFVKGYVDLLMDGEMGLLTAEQQSAIQIISDKTNEITRLIDDIITLQRIDAGNLQLGLVSMAELVQMAVMAHRLVADKKGLSIESVLPDEKGWVYIDKGRINQVLDNLIGNAMKFSPDGGTITVAVREEDDSVYVVISDQGIGVPAEKRQRIFERFYQVDGSSRRRFGGTGIGLAIVKRIIDAHKGKIWVESEEGKGSSFFFVLPKATDFT